MQRIGPWWPRLWPWPPWLVRWWRGVEARARSGEVEEAVARASVCMAARADKETALATVAVRVAKAAAAAASVGTAVAEGAVDAPWKHSQQWLRASCEQQQAFDVPSLSRDTHEAPRGDFVEQYQVRR